jgi:hypothetical protein
MASTQDNNNTWQWALRKVRAEWERAKDRRLGFIYGRPEQPQKRTRIKIPPPPPFNEAAVRAAYEASEISRIPDTFVLYRIIGNDLPPRHSAGQSRRNVEFILENEPSFESCEKRWVLNRIFDPAEEERIISILQARNQPFLRIPFVWEEFAKVDWDYSSLPSPDFLFSKSFEKLDMDIRQRAQTHIRGRMNNYVMNNNGARNAALRDGRARAKWVLPFDGNCFLTRDGFDRVSEAVRKDPWLPYFIVPMARVTENHDLDNPDYRPEATEEPQVIFRADAGQTFDETVPYGRRPKVHLLWTLAVPGPWDRYRFDPWDHHRPPHCAAAGQFRTAGWVARLDSGRPDLEVGHLGFINRGAERSDAIVRTLDTLAGRALVPEFKEGDLVFFDPIKIEQLPSTLPRVADELRTMAEAAMTRGPRSVLDKTTLAPSGDPRDYWHPAPYWWPDPARPDGPYIWRDGQRMPGTALYDPDSSQFDRTNLQYLFDDATVLALAGQTFQNSGYLDHAARLIRAWFIDPATRMNPHLKYAQVRRGHFDNEGPGIGIIEFKDIYFLLDAVRILAAAGALSESEMDSFRGWLSQYQLWLEASPAAMRERSADNNHGTFYDLQLGSIGAFLGDRQTLGRVWQWSKLRLRMQIDERGIQRRELGRTMPRHYVSFNLAGWCMLSRLASRLGQDLWSLHDQRLAKGFEWLIRAEATRAWPGKSAAMETDFDPSRLEPLWVDCRRNYGAFLDTPPAPSELTPKYHPDFGLLPFYMLARE